MYIDFMERSRYCLSPEKQDRGYWLERIFFEILELENISYKKSYKTQNEQIDGHFKFNSFDYLVEIKWTEDPVKQKDISIFEGKLRTKGQSTRGFILSISGFDESATRAATKDNPMLIFMDAAEFIAILSGYISFGDQFISKEDALVRLGKVYR